MKNVLSSLLKLIFVFTFLRNSRTAISLLQENHYYPFGMEMKGAWITQSGTENGYQYNGKELNEDWGLNWSDYGARWYDASVGRWNAVDPLVEKYKDNSPFSHVLNNPIKYVDPDGNLIVDQNGNIVVTTNNNGNGQPRRLLVEEPLQSRRTTEGYTRTVKIDVIYNDVTIYADNGTPIQAMQLVSARQIVTIVDQTGKIIEKFETPVTQNADCSSNCHGFTFANGKLLINPDQAKKLLENDGYQTVDKTKAQIVLLNDVNGEPQHSGVVNSDGTYNDKGGLGRPQLRVDFDKVQMGIDFKPPAVYMSKTAANTILNTTLGTEKNGVRTISDPEEIKKLINQLKDK